MEKGSFTCVFKKIWSNVLKKRAGLDCNVLSLSVYSLVLKFWTVKHVFSSAHTNKGFKIKQCVTEVQAQLCFRAFTHFLFWNQTLLYTISISRDSKLIDN